jgi:hypothetical protein
MEVDMNTWEEEVSMVIDGFMQKDELFTALDVSNEVKKVFPQIRHRQVRDEVRTLFLTFIEPKGWARTPITVNLDNGTTAEALLYHPLSASWDLDNKYDVQKRAQTAFRPVAVAQAAVQAAQAATVAAPSAPLPIRVYGALAPTPLSNTAAAATAAPMPGATSMTITPMPTARHVWDQMFQTQPSLFPVRK